MRARLVAATAAAALLPAFLVIGAAPAQADPGGNNGTVKIAEADADETTANDPHVACTFKIRWFNFDQGSSIVSSVSFASQAPTAAAEIDVTGSQFVPVGGDAAGGGTDLDGEQEYTLAFSGAAPQANQGYHVKVTVATPGSKGNDTKSKVFWVQPCGTEPTDPTDPTDPTEPTDPTDPTGPTEPTDPTDPTEPFTWDWTYDDPTCTGLEVEYPQNIPDGQSNDVNIRVETPSGSQTFNFHNNEGTWSGTQVFDLTQRLQGVSSYDITWVQVAGTNYHWQGRVGCVVEGGVLKTRTVITGFSTKKVTVKRNAGLTDGVVVEHLNGQQLQLQLWGASTWTTVRTIAVREDGTATVTFPTSQKGSFRYRLLVGGSSDSTGAATGTLSVKVR